MAASAWSGTEILDFLGSERKQEQPSCQNPARIKVIIWALCWCCRYWDELKHMRFLCCPTWSYERQAITGLPTNLPWPYCKHSNTWQGSKVLKTAPVTGCEDTGRAHIANTQETIISPKIDRSQKKKKSTQQFLRQANRANNSHFSFLRTLT